jgi:serine/threonine protein kinase
MNEMIAEQQFKVAKLLEKRGPNFTSPRYHRTGGVRNLYLSKWGPAHEVEVVAKVERTDFESPRARRHLERGCTTESEIRHVIGLDDSGVTRMIDYFGPEETAEVGLPGAVIVEEFIPKALSLEEWVSQMGPLDRRQLAQFTRSYVGTMQRIRKKGILHRDHKASNILLISDNCGNIKTKITDWANAARVDEVRSSVWPTAGGHLATHPKIMQPFSSFEEMSIYDDQCEVYGIASNIALAIRGKPIFDYDPDRGTAIAWDTGQSVLTEGKRDAIKHNHALKEATKKFPSELRRVMMNAMALETFSPYTLEEFADKAVHAARDPSFWDKTKKIGKWAATIIAPAALVGFGIWRGMTYEPQELKMPHLDWQETPIVKPISSDDSLVFVREHLTDLPIPQERYDGAFSVPLTKNRYAAAMLKAYLEAHHHLTGSWRPRENLAQYYMYSSELRAGEFLYADRELDIIVKAIEVGINRARTPDERVDLEDACVISRVGVDVVNKARYAANSRNFVEYIDARDPQGKSIIPKEDQIFLKTWLAYIK